MKIVYIVIMFVFSPLIPFAFTSFDAQLSESRYFSLINSAVPDVGIFLL